MLKRLTIRGEKDLVIRTRFSGGDYIKVSANSLKAPKREFLGRVRALDMEKKPPNTELAGCRRKKSSGRGQIVISEIGWKNQDYKRTGGLNFF